MKQSIQKLQKFFKLESERGYDNKAVMGGLGRMLDSWEAEARSEEIPEGLIQAVVSRLRDYYRLSESSREVVLRGLWSRMKNELGDVPIPDEKELLQEKTETEAAPSPKTEVSLQKSHSMDEAAQKLGDQEPRTDEPPPSDETPQHIEEELTQEETQSIPETTTIAGDEEAIQQKSSRKDEISHPSEAERGTHQESFDDESPSEGLEESSAALDAPITVIKGIGSRYAKTLKRLDLNTLGDMLYHFPRRYDDYSQMKPINRLKFGEEVTIIGTVKNVHVRSVRGGKMKLSEAVISDGSGSIRVSWFNQPWIAKRLKKGSQIVLSGKADQYLGRLVMNNPEWEPLEQKNLHTNRIVPVYPLTAKLTQRWLRQRMNQVVTYWAPRLQDPLPKPVRESANLLDLPTALLQIHFPDSWELLKSAQHRLAFDEIFLLQIGVLQQKHEWQERSARIFELPDESWLRGLVDQLPFKLTLAQQRALGDIRRDLSSGHPMNRLIQGDVGSGKTVVAALGVSIVTALGSQAAFMAPTSILAEQHYRSLVRLIAGETGILKPEQIRLLIGATPESEKTEIRERLKKGDIKVLVGTHALIEDPVDFADLQMVVIDEQHRFGVRQRAALRSKGSNPHLIVMTATPIPRSLALTVYGDLDLSVIDEFPPGREAVETYILYPRERERAYTLIRGQLERGHQSFIIYPLVEESDKTDAKAAVQEYTRIQEEIFPDYRVGLLHGRLRPDEKDAVMSSFRDRQYDIIVSTTVVEVGVDVPNATVMLVEGAHRFGLSQLHQLRGRVGRGDAKAYCLLIPEDSNSTENERLIAMAETNDGFELAERDLEQRGPGDFLGTRQSGYTELRLAKLTDVKLIEKARHNAMELFEEDPFLERPEYQLLAARLEHFWLEGSGDIS